MRLSLPRFCLYALAATLLLAVPCIVPSLAWAEDEAPNAEKPPKPDKAEKAEAPKKGEDGKPLPDAPGPHYVVLQPMVLPILGDNGPEQLITLLITLQVETEDQVKEVKSKIPRLTDAYLQKLYGALDKGMMTHGDLIDVSLVKHQLQEPTQRIYGPDLIKDVLVQSVAQRHL